MMRLHLRHICALVHIQQDLPLWSHHIDYHSHIWLELDEMGDLGQGAAVGPGASCNAFLGKIRRGPGWAHAAPWACRVPSPMSL